jgi:Tetratricopeptide repeat
VTRRRNKAAKRDRAAVEPARSDRAGAREDPGAHGAHPLAATRTLVAILVVLTAARALLALVPSMWGWGLNVMRFVPSSIAWATWGVGALALVPRFSRMLAPVLARVGDGVTRTPTLVAIVAGLLGFALLWELPDRVRFVGDFLLRQGALNMGAKMGTLIPQALPLDLFLHYRLPIMVASTGLADVGTVARVAGALEGGMLAMLAVAFARVLGLGDVAAVAAAAVVFFGGYLALFTGYSKAFVELCVITAAVGVYGVRALRDGGGLLPLGIALALGFAMHRSAVALLPAAVLAWVLWLRRHGAGGAWKRPAAIAGIALPLVALAAMLPRILGTLLGFDAAMHVMRSDVAGHSGWRMLLEGTRPIDVVNLVLALAPLALAILVLPWTLRGRLRLETGYLGLLAAPWLAILAVVRPLQGLHRDWDVVAAGGVALSLLAAALAGETLRGARRSWVGVAVTLGVLVPAVQWLVHDADADRGLERARAFATESPRRSDRDRGATWDYVGIRSFGLQRWGEAADAFAHAAETTPSPRVLMQWGFAEMQAGHPEAAQRVYQRLVEKTPDDLSAWVDLAVLSLRLGDEAEARRAANELLRRRPGHQGAIQVLAELSKRALLRSATPR